MGNIQFKDCCSSNNNIDIDIEPDSDDEYETIYKKNKNIKMVKNNYKTAPGPPVFI